MMCAGGTPGERRGVVRGALAPYCPGQPGSGAVRCRRRWSLTPILLGLLACMRDPEPEPLPEPGPLLVGVARVRMPVPVGIGTAGYGGFGVDGGPSPFADIYPATEGIRQHPDFRAIALSRSPGFEVVLLRTDTIGIFQQLRRAVVLELQERLGRDLDHALVIGATHTHSGPGRVIDVGGPFDLITDRFLPEFYVGLVDAMADAVELALDDLKPGRIGLARGTAPDGINDRRCEDGLDHENPTLPIVAVEQEGELVALQLAYAIHGTVLSIDDLTLSQDVSGAIEHAVADRFDHPVQVQMFNSWGADMAPADPAVPEREGAAQRAGYDQMERVGMVVADAVETALSSVEWDDAPELGLKTWRVPVDREAIGYGSSEFDFDYGAVYCSAGEPTCEGGQHIDGLDAACLGFTEEFPAPNQTEISAGRVGDLHFVTFPGEPGTLLAEQVMSAIQANHADVQDLAFFGYSQDYLGYSILEDDWWNGGYEASGALWGPRQGEYLAERAVAAFGWTQGAPADAQPDPAVPFEVDGYTPYAPTPGQAVGDVLVDVQASVGPTDTVVFEVAGSDPWLGAPIATLQRADGSPVLRPSGLPVDSDGLAFAVRLVPEPSYVDAPSASSRTFRWIFELPVRHRQDVGLPDLSGDLRIQVSIPSGDGTLLTATSSTFQVSAP